MRKIYIRANSVSKNIDGKLDSLLQDFAQVTGEIDYNDIIDFGNIATRKDISDLKSCFRKLNAICREMGLDYWEAAQEDAEAADYVSEIKAIVRLGD